MPRSKQEAAVTRQWIIKAAAFRRNGIEQHVDAFRRLLRRVVQTVQISEFGDIALKRP